MDSFVRLKYRPPTVQPEGKNVKENQTVSLAKKVKPPPNDDKNKIVLPPYQAIPMDPSLTQKRIVSRRIFSDEKEFRAIEAPDVFERVKLQKLWKKKTSRDHQNGQNRQYLMNKWNNKIKDALNFMEETEKSTKKMSRQDDGEDDGDDDEEAKRSSVKSSVRKSTKKSRIEEAHDEDEDDIDDQDEETAGIVSAAKKQVMILKERTIIKSRLSVLHHNKVSSWFKYSHWLMLMLHLGKRDYNLTHVLPWLIIAKGNLAKDYKLLMKLCVTHILNVTRNVEEYLPDFFIYKRIAIDDGEGVDIGLHFDDATAFMRRVEERKGKIFVHCTSSVSRAPTLVIAYLIRYRDISLADAYDFIMALRPNIKPNKHFLYQLAEYEISFGQGSSVLNRKEWDIFEFNCIRSRQLQRPSIGLSKTFRLLYKQHDVNSKVKAVESLLRT